ncbi:non-ribosomal peptide synthetase [Ktedonobacteria bacterium brp13]|nr:non-ribosomal peptide synthetase [Ktedonobacteria bacterium brp13]
MKDSLERPEKVSPDKQALLGKLLQRKGKQLNIFPASFAQQRMWLLDQIATSAATYTIPSGLRLEGKLKRQVFEQALNEIVSRHAVLRTVFPAVGGRPVQMVKPFSHLPLVYYDLRHLSDADRAEKVQRLLDEETYQPFDLATGPLFRSSLLQLAEEEHILLLTAHHIVFDGWSQGILVQEMMQLYEAFALNLPSPLPPLALQYTDYTQWQREWLQGFFMQEQLAFWRKQLGGMLPTLELPADRPRPPVRTFAGSEYAFVLPQATAKALIILSQQEGVTLFMTLLAAFTALLSRYSGQTDVLVGTPIANRTRAEVENLIGCFINTIVLRTDLSDNPSLRTLLKRVQQVALDAYAHQELPFEKIVEELHPERDLSHSPIFQTLFAFQNAPQPSLTLSDLTMSGLPIPVQVADFDLSLYMWETAEGLAGTFKYNTDLFDTSTIARVTTHFQRLLEDMGSHPDHRVSEISLLNAAERAQILAQWNDTQSTFPADTCVQQLIEAQVERTPDAVAVIFEGQPLTYRQLNSRANQLAHLLQAEGVGPEMLVGVSMERSLELVVALLAILKAGGAYVPLDPSYPTERLRYLLEDAGVALVLTQSRFTQQLVHEGVKLICLDPDWHVHRQGNEQNPSSTVGPDNMVYMIYTSGSTGQPKGVINIHRALSNRLHWMQQAYQLTEKDRVLQKTPFSFDVSVWEFFWPLISGARLVVARPGGHQDTVYLAELIASEQISTLHFVPSMLQAFLLEPQLAEQCRSLRHVVTSGEALSLDLQTRFFASFPDEQVGLHNLYGPTEAAIDVTVWECQREGEQAGVPIGYPIANTQIYILDAALQPTPIGVPGELYIGGVGLARGYHRRVALTREKFIADPFGAEDGARLFKTADLARYRADGAIEFLGRIDYQVKIRGMRIELGEIEAALSQHPQVQSVVVLAREDVPGDKRLVAYLVTKEEVAESTWHAYLGQRLPAYMIPSIFMQLDALPLNSNGKVDRRALPIPEQGKSQVEYLAPRTPLEEQLAQIWAQVLDTERVGVLDNFFDLGGHSLKATQIMSRVRQASGIMIPLRHFFEDPTIAGQAKLLEHTREQQEDNNLTMAPQPISREKHQQLLQAYLEGLPTEEIQAFFAAMKSSSEVEREVFPVSFVQQRMWVLDQIIPDPAAYTIPGGIRLLGKLSRRALEQTLAEIISRHNAFRTVFLSVGGRPVQVVQSSSPFQLSYQDLRHLSEVEREEQMQQLLNAEMHRSFDLSTGPLFCPTLVQLADEEHVLLLTIHHIVFDGWSRGVMVNELVQLYEAFVNNQPSPLSPLAFQYTDYTQWQRRWFQGARMQEHLAFWRQQLRGPLPKLELPADRPLSLVQSSVGARYAFTLPQATSTRLAALGQQERVTLFMILLAAFNVLLSRYSGQTDLLIGTPIANRTRSELESMIGCFINTVVIRLDISDNPSLRTLLKRAQQASLDAYAHQDLPFEKVVEEVQPERDLKNHSPLFQVMFVFQNAPQPPFVLNDLAISFLPTPDHSVAGFNLTLYMWEEAGRLEGCFEYNTDLYEEATFARLTTHFQKVLEDMLARPDQLVSEVALLSAPERKQILEQWNDTQSTFPSDVCVHQLIEAQVERTPDALAVKFAGQSRTYQELNCEANQLAHLLQAEGVGPETLVGVSMERSLELVVALLAILKAGGAYVPIDPSYPTERLRYLLEDSGVSLVLTQSRFTQRLVHEGVKLICLDPGWNAALTGNEHNPSSAVAPDNLMYMIYTSGSTGRPKGVLNVHRAVCNRLIWGQRLYPLTVQDRVLQKTPFNFDVSVPEFFWPLLAGATLSIARPGGHQEADYLVDLIEQERITSIHFVPSMLQAFLLEPNIASRCSSLRQVFTSGEALSLELQEQFFACFPDPQVQLHNLYGPTEAAIEVSAWTCIRQGEQERKRGKVPIGRPIDNVRLHVLDARMQPVPVGVPGELHIGGVALARGYHNQAELSREKFIPDPFSLAGDRLYKTGDLVLYRADGVLEYLGRMDHQVKIRGFRIELGEIESCLIQHPSVKSAVVLAREDVPGDKRLVAYVVASEQVAESEWKVYLSQRLPEYMLPAIFMRLDALPLTASGKVDRQALPVPEQGLSRLEYVAPRSPLEEQLAQIWAEVLAVGPIGVLDNFFEIGGHSLKATQIISRARQLLGVKVSLRNFFEDPTVAGLAGTFERAMQQQKETGTGTILAIQPLSRELHQERLQLYLTDIPDREVQTFLATISTSSEPATLSSVFPVSFAQQRMWVLDQIAPGMATNTILSGLRMVGKLHQRALERALAEIVKRHAVLRTVFSAIGGRPVQVVQSPSFSQLCPHDLRHLSKNEREAEAQRLITEEAQRPFDLATGHLFRVLLLQLAEDDHMLVLTIHHIVFDGWSQGVLLQEFAQLYDAFSVDQPSPLPTLSLQYTDYTQWQREWLQGAVMQEQLTFWRKQLSGALPVLELPTDRPRPPMQTAAGARYPFALSLTAAQGLMTLSQQEGTTLFMTLLAAFTALLSRYSGQTDVLVGTPIANRTHAEVEDLIGCFINTIVLRTDLSDNPSLSTLLKRVQQVALDAYAHQDLPFEKVVEELQPERDLSRTPLFQVMFVFQNAPQSSLGLRDLSISGLPMPTQVSAKFDLTLYMWKTAEGIGGSFEYNTDLFDEITLVRLTTHFQRVLEAMIAHPDHRVSEISLLNAAERAQILAQWNDTQSTFPADTCVQQLIEAQVERTPDAVAVIFEGQPLTYRQLNSRANQLAHLLQAEGVGPETLVGVSMERSLELVVALLAILKAGGAYVPLDPSYPTERLRYLLEDAGVALVLTQSRFTQQLVHEGVKLICLDPDWHVHRQGNEQNLSSTVGPDNMVYMIYTSGSTGQPKGVINIHRALSNRLHWMQQAYQLTEEDRVLQKTPFSFDVSVWEFFWPLISGARLVVARPGGHQDTVYLAELIASEQINTLHFVPSMLQAFLLEPQLVEQCRSLRHVVTSGEALSLDLQTRFFASFPDERVGLHNLYGPTEAAIDVTVWECQREGEQASVPIGYPIANTQIYILDAALQPTPIGVPGELYIGGVGLARGYHRRVALTREKFIADPFGAEEGARLFKTADLARYRADGAIEFLGRIDYQVKIRGMRIELGEIEAVLSQHPQVQSVVVLAREDVPGDKRLVAYLITKEEVAESTWRAYLGQRLPAYMIPSTFMQLDALPLNSNGKVDRRALPIPEQGRSQVEYLAPCTPLEEQLAQIWAQVLGLERVGVQDNFFEIGGHSLLAVQVLARMRAELQKSLPLSSFFKAQNVATMAHLIGEGELQVSRYLVPIKTTGTRPPLFCFHAAGGDVLPYRALADAVAKDIPMYGLQSQAVEGMLPEHTSIEAMAREYAIAIRNQQPEGPYSLLGWSMGGAIAVAVASELERAGQRVALVALLDTYLSSPEDRRTQQVDPLHGLGLVIEAAIARMPEPPNQKERQALQTSLQALSNQEQAPYVLNWGKKHKILPDSLSLEVLLSQAALANTHRALFTAYTAPIIEASLAVWWAREPLNAHQTQALTDWQSYTRGRVQERVVDGNHFTMINQPHIQIVAHHISDLYEGSFHFRER